MKAQRSYTVSTLLAALRQLQGARDSLGTIINNLRSGTESLAVQLGADATSAPCPQAAITSLTSPPPPKPHPSNPSKATTTSASPIIPPSSSTPCCCSGGPNACRSPRQHQPLLRLRGRPIPVAAPAVAPCRQRGRRGSVLAHRCRLVYFQLTQLQIQGISDVRQPPEAVTRLNAASMACRGAR